ncbi:MAG: valine--tRNA ligase [Methermicoccaceae archaeon]
MLASPVDVPKEYDATAMEQKWQSCWEDEMYYFDEHSERPRYIIDTPPPYPTGSFHIGNALNWCYIDFIARYKRMRGYNVMFPQGWDCHGLPTEVKVEETHGITKSQVPRAKFRELCEKLTLSNIEYMRSTMRRLGFSVDWSHEYITMKPEYYVQTQISFLEMYKKGLIYRDNHPVNWCPRCETAIAYAEVEYENKQGMLNFLHFDSVDIATTRPELLCACVAVAVHPDDERYQKLVGKTLKVPLFGHEVRVIADEAVDPSFGTGVVMICTFGDKQDVRWWKQHSLALRVAIDRTGRMTEIAGKYVGLTVDECKRAVVDELKKEGFLYDAQEVEQSIGVCWRCKSRIEILSEPQWFIKVQPKKVLERAREVQWVPEHMFTRLTNWVEEMEWDWCISRQRLFATPIPVWYCAGCGKEHVASRDELPIDPTQRPFKGVCPTCGSEEFVPEKDVLDTWMDSSISALHTGKWLSDAPLLPTQLRPQGHDIIRTWAFYTLLRADALTDLKPWDTIVINGMVLGEDGHKMSKSKGNIIQPEEVMKEYGADAFRQWAAIGGSTGSDIMFRWKDVVAASRFQQKLWNIARFSKLAGASHAKNPALRTADRWILSKLQELIETCTLRMDAYEFDETLKAIRVFAWEVLADNYIELVKGRLYGGDEKEKVAAQHTLCEVVLTLAKLVAPFMPHLAEEVYSLFEAESVHMQPYPEVQPHLTDKVAEHEGALITQIASSLRRYKSDHKVALNAPLKEVMIYTDGTELDTVDISNAINAKTTVITHPPVLERRVAGFTPNMAVLGPMLRRDAGKAVEAMHNIGGDALLKMVREGSIRVQLDGNELELPPDSIQIEEETLVGGERVDMIEMEKATLLVSL